MYKILTLSLLVFSLAGCNTLAGVGSDISKGGEAITKAAEEGTK